MLKKFAVILLVLSFATLGFAKGEVATQMYQEYDLAPGAFPEINQPIDDQWDLQVGWEDMETQSGDNGMLGITFDGTNVWVTGRGTGPNMVYIFDPVTGVMTNSFQSGSTTSWGCRDLCFDGTYVYSGWESGVQCWDLQFNFVTMLPFPAGQQFPRAIAYEPASDHFYTGNFGSTCYEFDRNGNMIRSWAPAPLSAVYGMAWDDDGEGGPWLWVHDQTTPASGCNVHQFDPATLTYTGVFVSLDVPPSPSDMAGGLDYHNGIDPLYTSMLVFNQGTPDAGAAFEMYMDTPPDAPAAPTGFTITTVGAILEADLAWTNPTTQVNGDPLTDLDGVYVSRNGTLLADLTTAGIGAAMTYNDNGITAAGMYTYSVQPYNTAGDGIPATDATWIGIDVPAAPGDFTVTPDPGGALSAACAWTAPTVGAHGGFFPGVSNYTLYRMPEGGAWSMVADLITGTSYEDTSVPSNGFYYYGVAGNSASGEGDMAESEMVFIGPPEFEPYPYDWFDISTVGTNSGINGDDQNLGPFPLPFAFPWYDGQMMTSIRICSNGWLSFTSTSTAYTNYAIPTAAVPNDLVAPFWDDLNPSSSGAVYIYDDIANDRWICQFHEVPHFSTAGRYTFQTILQANGDVIYMWNELTPGTANSATVGIENSAGTVGVQLTYNGSGPIEPAVGTGAIIYGFTPPPPPDVEVTLTPEGTIVLPAGGGAFDFNIAVLNNEATLVTLDIWTDITLPTGPVVGPLINVPGFPMAGGWGTDRDRVQGIPPHAPAGVYTYNGYMGMAPSLVYAEDHFTFTKTAADNGGVAAVEGWACWGEAFPGEAVINPNVIETYTLSDAYPNPFNPVAHISYNVPELAQVQLIVYDVIGREVATLVDGWVNAGSYQVTFDANGLSSGVYFYRLQAGEFSSVKKMVLMK